METDFLPMDLHVHTPESKCFRGKREGKDYIDILRQCKKAGLRIIAITDHNTIRGYKKFIQIKDDLTKKSQEPKRLSANEQDNKESDALRKSLALFEAVTLLPGVEFETKNNIHLLVIFNPSIPIKEIEDFIVRGGYEEPSQGLDDPPFPANWDVLELYENAKALDCLIIDAHTDSDKGLFNYPKGGYRAQCLKSGHLSGVCYKSEAQRSNLERLFSESLDYKRTSPLAFIRSSDSHSIEELGRNISWIKLEKIDFEEIKKAFLNPVENISTEPPSSRDILKKLIARNDSFGIAQITEENKDYYRRLICALMNTDGGYCLVGVDEKKRMIGIDVDKKPRESVEFEKCLKSATSPIGDILGSPEIGIGIYPTQKSRVIVSLNVKSSPMLSGIKGDDRIYSLKNREVVALNSKEIQTLVEERQAKVIRDKIAKNVDSIKAQCDFLTDTIEYLSIGRIFEENSTLLVKLISGVEIREAKKITVKDQAKLIAAIKKRSNGTSKGNIAVIDEPWQPRLKDAYLRYSLPRYYLRGIATLRNRETIYLVNGGAVFYSEKDRPIFSTKGLYAVIFRSEDKHKYSDKFLVAFIKSSFWIWYSLFRFESKDLFRPDLFKKIRVPTLENDKPRMNETVSAIERKTEEIIRLENAFLKKTYEKKEDALRSTADHNRAVDRLAYSIDKMIYEMIGLTKSQVEKIEHSLCMNGVYLPESRKDI